MILILVILFCSKKYGREAPLNYIILSCFTLTWAYMVTLYFCLVVNDDKEDGSNFFMRYV